MGLHKIPLACDIRTDYVFWPARQTVTITLAINETNKHEIDSTYLPLIEVNRTDKVHASLRELINALPTKDDKFTIDYDYYNLSLEKIQTYTSIAQVCLAVIVIINSILIGILFARWFKSRQHGKFTSRNSSFRDKFSGLKDSIRSRHLRNSDSFRNARNNVRARTRKLRDSFRSRSTSSRHGTNERKSRSPRKVAQVEPPIRPHKSENIHTATNTDLGWNLPPYPADVYPVLPKY